jgi:PAS domain S-box-containing protein
VEQKKRSSFSNTMRINLLPDVGHERPGAAGGVGGRSPHNKTGQVAAARPYHDLLESIYDAALIADDEGNVLEFNGRAVAFLKYPPNALSGLHVWDIIAGADEQTMGLILENLAAERFTLVQAYCLCSDGSHFPAEVAVSRLRQVDNRFCMLIRNISVRREAEERLLIEHNALKNTSNGVVITDVAGTITYANPAFDQLVGVETTGTESSLRGTGIATLPGDGAALVTLLEATLESRVAQTTELALQQGTRNVTLEATVSANVNTDGDLVGAVFSFTDLTDRMAVEGVRKEAEQQRVMLESMGAACHHLGQPATVLMTSVDLLRKRVGDEPDAAKLLDRCDEMCTRLGDTLRQMQRMTKYQTRQYTDEGISEILSLDENTD